MSTTMSRLERERRATRLGAHPNHHYANLTATTLLSIQEPDLSDAVPVPRVARPRGHYGLSLFERKDISLEQTENVVKDDFFYFVRNRDEGPLWKQEANSKTQPRVGLIEAVLTVLAFGLPAAVFLISAWAGYSMDPLFFVVGTFLAYLLRVAFGSMHAAAVAHAICGPLGKLQNHKNEKVSNSAWITGFDEKYITPKLLMIFARIYQHHGDEIEANMQARSEAKAEHARGFSEAYKQVLAERYLPSSERSPEIRAASEASNARDDGDEFQHGYGIVSDPARPIVNTNGNVMLPGGAFDVSGQPFGS